MTSCATPLIDQLARSAQTYVRDCVRAYSSSETFDKMSMQAYVSPALRSDKDCTHKRIAWGNDQESKRMLVPRRRLFISKTLSDFSRKCGVRYLAGVSIVALALSTTGCTESLLGYNGAASQANLNAPPPAQEAPGLGVNDLAVPPIDNRGGSYGQQGGYSRSRPMIYRARTRLRSTPIAVKHPLSTCARMPRGDAIAGPSGGYQLNFESADVATVAKVIFGDILKANYIVDPRVTGQISLSSSGPVPSSRLVPLLEAALLSANASVVKDPDGYRIAPTGRSGWSSSSAI